MKNKFHIQNDTTILDSKGKIIFFSVEKFIKEIALGDSCFICGAKPESKPFNDEHVIPDWILRKYELYNKQITIPNGQSIPYSQYKVPCCVDCNSLLGKKIEEPISQIISKGFEGIIDYINKNGAWLFFIWLNLLFFKVQLRDRHFRYFSDKREPEVKISELTNWTPLHHIHCIVRSIYTKCKIDPKVFGSLIVLPAIDKIKMDHFDYGDNVPGKGVLIRLGGICFISILNDSCASLNLFSEKLNKINGNLSPLQYREILAHLSFLNVNLVQRPLYFTDIDKENDCKIIAKLPDSIEFRNNQEFNFSDFLLSGCQELMERSNDPRKDEILMNMKKGRWTFLFDENGNFIKN